MSVVSEDVWSREDSAEVILERRVACGTRSQRKKLVAECLRESEGSHNLVLHRQLLLF